jgi:hypothetical protein
MAMLNHRICILIKTVKIVINIDYLNQKSLVKWHSRGHRLKSHIAHHKKPDILVGFLILYIYFVHDMHPTEFNVLRIDYYVEILNIIIYCYA